MKKPFLYYKSFFSFAFFNSKISEKYGKKCCRYGLNGIPLPENTVKVTYNNLAEFLDGWKFNKNFTSLLKHYYMEDYRLSVKFLAEIVRLDAENTRNCPSFSVKDGQILILELYSPSIKGLSQVDFELAMMINRIPFKEYQLIELKGELENFKEEVRQQQFQRESSKIQEDLAKEEGKMKKI